MIYIKKQIKHKLKYTYICLFLSVVGCNNGSSTAYSNGLNPANGDIVKKESLGTFLPADVHGFHGNYSFTLEEISYISDGLKIDGFIASPIDVTEKHPVILYLRGGNNIEPLSYLTKQNIFQQIAYLASFGYIVAASNYRGSPGSEGKDEFGGNDVIDNVNILASINKYYHTADLNNLGVLAFSRGGMMAYLLSKRNLIHPKIYQINSGIADLESMVNSRPDMYELLVTRVGFNKEQLIERSATYWPQLLQTDPVYKLYIAGKDVRVGPDTEFNLFNSMKRLNYNVFYNYYPNATHGIKENSLELRESVVSSFKQTMLD